MRDRKTSGRSARPRGPARIAEVKVDLEMLSDPVIVSDISAAHGRSDRFRLTLNGIELGDLTLDYVATHALRAGRELTRDDTRDVIDAAGRTIVLDKALDLLAVRSRSARDLRLRLRRAGADDAAITWAVDRLTAQGYVDDGAYARQVARSKVLSGGVSRRNVVNVLRRRGIPAEVADEAIDETLQDVDLDEEGAALALARKRLRSLASLDPAKRRQRLYSYLARRGYEGDVVRRVLAEVLR